MTLDIVQSVLGRAASLPAVVSRITQEIRALSGARTVVMFGAHPKERGPCAYRLLGVTPEQRRAQAESAGARRLVEMIADTSRPVLWRFGAGHTEAEGILKRLGYGLSLGLPLQAGPDRLGALLVLGLADDQRVQAVVEMQDTLARVFALVLQNARLIEQQSTAIADRERAEDALPRSKEELEWRVWERTAELRDVNERLHVELLERTQAEREREALIELLRLLNTSEDTQTMMRSTTALLSHIADCEAVGIRLRDGQDFPYFETRGFSDEFVQAENRLCAMDERGEMVRDSRGNPVLECMCGNVLCGRFDPSKPFFTAHGSFWTNCTTGLLGSTTEAERQSRTRNRCNGEGYESVALLPLRVGETTLGLIQFNDRRRGRFTTEKVAMLERFAGHLAIGLAHRRAEAALRESEERYRTVADFTYDWEYWIGPDGALLYCSPACERITGYRAEEFERDPSLLAAIVHSDDRTRAASHVGASPDSDSESHELDYRIRTRNGEERWIAHACRVVRGHNGVHLGRRASNRDITERKRIERVNTARLRLLQFAATHSLDELLEATLNEAEGLTGSVIGFYHFLGADEKTLSLQNWSTRTKAEFCTAEGKGRHYDISVAGVWVDCIRERRPIIHNDYSSLPHRKGYPPGHAAVVRELVVPVFRGDRIVAVLGVGNKPQDYSSGDVVTLCLMADLAWDIAERKRAEQESCRANRALRVLSECNQAVIRAAHEAELLTAVCQVVVESGEYRAAWVGYAEEDAARSVRPMAQAGFEAGDLEALRMTWADSERGVGTTGRAIRTGRFCVARQAEDDPVLASWSERRNKDGPACSLGLPLFVGGKPVGALSIYSDAADGFDAREIGLLCEMASDLAYGIETQRTRSAHARAEAGLQLFRQLTDQSNDAIFVIEPQTGRVLDVNDTAGRVLGYSRKELLNLRVSDFDPGMRGESRWAEHLQAVRTSGGLTLESTHQRKDGTTFPVEISVSYTVQDQKNYLIGAVRDITERKRAQDDLQRSNELLRAVIEAAPTAIIGLDLAGNVQTVWNPAAEKMLGWSAREVVGRPLPTVPAESQEEFASFRERIRAGMTLDGVEVRRQRRDGTAIDYSIYASPLHDSEGRIIGNIAVLVDISRRKKAEEELRRSERQKTILNRIASIVLTAPDEDMYSDVLAVILDVLRSPQGLFGFIADNGDLVTPSLTEDVWKQRQISGKPIVFPSGSWGESVWGRAIREKTSFVSNGPFHTPAGHLSIHSFLSTPIIFGDRSIGILSVANRDGGYTEENTALLETIAGYLAPILNARLQRDRMERERKRAEERIVRQLREKELLVREIHHRVKNNMQVIASLLDLQIRQAGNEQLRELLAASRGRIRTMAMVHERLYTAEDMACINLRGYIQALVTESLGLYGVTSDQVEVEVDVEQWTLAVATAIPCGLIIHELLSNALRHAFPGRKRGHVGISLVRTGSGSVELIVKDDGVGVPKDLDCSETQSLGLRLVRILATDQLGGTVSIRRENGTQVQVRFRDTPS